MNEDLSDYIYDAFFKINSKIGKTFEEINGFLDQIRTNIDTDDLDDIPFGWYSAFVEYYFDCIERSLRIAESEIETIHKKLNKMVDDFE